MKAGIFFLVLAYVFSQFYRSFLAVLTPVLGADIGTTPGDLSFASGLWFVVFAAMQVPVGWALDRVGPRLTAAALFGVGGCLGTAVFAMATGPWSVSVAMVLYGIACSPVLMASYYIFVRAFPPAVFATLGGAVIGFGSLGNLASTAPLAMLVDGIGWRATMWWLGLATLIVAVAIAVFVRDPERQERDQGQTGGFWSLLTDWRMLLIAPILLFNYAPSAGIRGLWAGPYLEHVFGADALGIGRATLVMALAMTVGSFVLGPMERYFGSSRKVIVVCAIMGAGALFYLWSHPGASILASMVAMAVIGFVGASNPVLVSHGREFIPAHLTGRGLTLLNLFSMGGVGLMQFVTSRYSHGVSAEMRGLPEFYGNIFLIFGCALVAGLLLYLFCPERRYRTEVVG
ncbi:MFS transporter [Amaricoccus tamworthensis]|uniref:MFS transporter n=1 Tax=Amaricoccus tamworthensis TaxID=57002 RepID=UPI003C7E7297